MTPVPDLRAGMQRTMRWAILAGLAALALSVLGWLLNPEQFYRSYLFAYVLWTGMSLGCLALMLLHHLVRGGWGFPVQRLLEAGARTLPLMALLFVPLVFGLSTLYLWARPEVVAGDEVLQHKAAYLNEGFFILRTALYFLLWSLLAWGVTRLSYRLDESGSSDVLDRLRGLSAAGIVLFGLSVTFSGIDWVMSLEPHWFSTIFAALVAMGQLVGAASLVIALLVLLARFEPLKSYLTVRHLHDLGSLLLTGVIMWAYFAFSQYMLIWMGNLPEEIPWYLRRLEGGWQYVAIAIVLLRFALPFALLISRDVKRDRRRLAAVAVLLLAMHLVDTYWLVTPGFEERASHLRFHWLDLALLLGLGGLWSGLFLQQLRGHSLLPRALPAPAPQRAAEQGAE